MASHIAILWMISALGCPGLDAERPSTWPSTWAAPALPGGFTQVSKYSIDVSHAKVPGSDAMAQRSAGPDVPASRPPVPFLRQPRPASSVPIQPGVPEVTVEEESQDALDVDEVKAAIERDGYKKVMVLGKANTGAWRAKAYRGAAEVFLRVDAHGTVSAE